MFIGENPQPFSRDEGGKPVHCGLDERALSHDRKYLLGMASPAAWPEACAAASGQDQAVVSRHGLLDRVTVNQSERPAPAGFGEEVLQQIDEMIDPDSRIRKCFGGR